MKSRRHDVSEDRQTILRRRIQFNAEEYSLPIPIDLIIEIFLRLPVKSIARCRCVPKLCASILVRPYFTDSFLARSSARPQLLFACHNQIEGKVQFYFSAPQPQNPEENSSTIAANYHMNFAFDRTNPTSRLASGFLSIKDHRILKGKKTREVVLVICNPSTGQSFTLPKMKTRKRINIPSFLGYDPIGKQHKLLAMTYMEGEQTAEHQVLILGGTGKLTWRMIECSIPHGSPVFHDICINGVLYFKTRAPNRSSNDHDMIICFDVKSEKFNFVKVMGRISQATLVNYNGKLALVKPQCSYHMICSTTRSFEMWVLQDPEKHEWSKHIYRLPSLGKFIDAGETLHFAGVIGANEIVLCPRTLFRKPFYVYYFNLERETIRRVEIQLGLEAFERRYIIDTFRNHVEDVELMKLF